MRCGLLTQQVMPKLRYGTLRGNWIGFLLNIIKWKAARFFFLKDGEGVGFKLGSFNERKSKGVEPFNSYGITQYRQFIDLTVGSMALGSVQISDLIERTRPKNPLANQLDPIWFSKQCTVIKKIKQYKYNFKLKQWCKINNMFVGIFKNSF